MTVASSAPNRLKLNEDDPKTSLYRRVADAVLALPSYFESDTTITGIQATDLFALNSVLSASIEVQVVRTLNNMRSVWDPTGSWQTYSFERQSQTFPDVRLVSRDGDSLNIAMGIELKGWYLLSKEGEPSLRFATTPAACADHDLIAVVPWHLSDVLSGTPVITSPWVESASYAAEYRNHWWQHVRTTTADAAIHSPDKEVGPYPIKSDMVADKPASDKGSNFGRLARTGIMDSFISVSLSTAIAGIEAEHWINFFKAFSEGSDPAKIREQLQRRFQGRS